MTRILLICLWYALPLTLTAQVLEGTGYHTSSGAIIRPHQAFRSTPARVLDTLELPYVRRSANRALTLNSATSAAAMGQYYEAPGPVTISGFEFFAYQSDATSNATVNIKCAIYAAAGTLPTGAPLAETTVPVAKQINTNLEFTRREARFTNPVTVSGPFILVVENPTSIGVSAYCNNWDNKDGDGEFLASFFFQGGWRSAASVTVGSVPFDADGYLLPFVSYDFDHSFTLSKRCMDGNDTVRLRVQSNSFRDNRFYNKSVFQGKTGRQLWSWDLGQNGPPANFVDSSIVYLSARKYVVTLTTAHSLWTSNRTFVYRDSMDVPPTADFGFLVNGYDVTFSNLSQGVDAVLWSFGDSVFSTLLQPVYRYPRPGQYDVTLIVKNGCSADTITRTVNIVPNGLNTLSDRQWTVYPNPTFDEITLNHLPAEATVLMVTDMSGRTLMTVPLNSPSQTFSVQHLPAGQYLMLLQQDDTPLGYKLLTKW